MTIPSPVSPTHPRLPPCHSTLRSPGWSPVPALRSFSPAGCSGGWAHHTGTAPVLECGRRSGAGTAKSQSFSSVARKGNHNQSPIQIGLRIERDNVYVSAGWIITGVLKGTMAGSVSPRTPPGFLHAEIPPNPCSLWWCVRAPRL